MSFWNHIFRRDQSPPTPPASDEPKLNEDWAPGDQAQCIRKFYGWSFKMPVKDEVYIVRDVQLRDEIGLVHGVPVRTKRKAFGLSLRGLEQNIFWDCRGFRKIVPRKDEETTDIGMSALIKHCNPAPVEVG